MTIGAKQHTGKSYVNTFKFCFVMIQTIDKRRSLIRFNRKTSHMHKLLVTAALKHVRQLESISEIQSVMISLTSTFAGRKR